MPLQSLSINELVMLLALDDDNGKVRWSVSPYLDYALAGGILAELALRGDVVLTNDRKNLHLARDPRPTGSALLDDVVARFHGPELPESVGGWVSSISTTESLDHRQMDELAAKGILGKREGHFLLIFPTTVYPALDLSAEKHVIGQIRAALLEDSAVTHRLAVLITIAHGAHLLRNFMSDAEIERALPRLTAIRKGDPVGEATCELIQQSERALYVASSIPFMGVSRI